MIIGMGERILYVSLDLGVWYICWGREYYMDEEKYENLKDKHGGLDKDVHKEEVDKDNWKNDENNNNGSGEEDDFDKEAL